jgi:hypothetical protein
MISIYPQNSGQTMNFRYLSNMTNPFKTILYNKILLQRKPNTDGIIHMLVMVFAPPGRGFVAMLLNFCSCSLDNFVIAYTATAPVLNKNCTMPFFAKATEARGRQKVRPRLAGQAPPPCTPAARNARAGRGVTISCTTVTTFRPDASSGNAF